MNQLFFYLVQVIIASAILYGYYYFVLRNSRFHKYNRYYLLIAVIFSIVVPLLKLPVYITDDSSSPSVMLQTLRVITSPASNEIITPDLTGTSNHKTIFTAGNILYGIYLSIAFLLLLRILFSLFKIRNILSRYGFEKIEKIKFVNTDEPGTPFSFFRWLFWNRKIDLHTHKGEQIFKHEYYHIAQKHSWDILFMEIISMIFWFNPVFHLIKKEIKAIHEFLADEFAVRENDRWQYAELLLMQLFNTSNSLVHPFFHNQIKRRIAMITTSSKTGFRYFRKIMVLPIAVIAFILLAFSYKNRSSESATISKAIVPITVVIDAGHGGRDRGAVNKESNYTEAELALQLSREIQSLSNEYNINVVMTRENENLPGNVSDVNEGIRKRVEMVNNTNPDAFIAIHLNTTPSLSQTSKSGFEVYVTYQRNNDADFILANNVIRELASIYHTKDEINQRKDAGIYVLDRTNYPSILIECGYINNPADISFITNKENQKKIARSILAGLVNFVNVKATSVIDQNKLSDTTKPQKVIYKQVPPIPEKKSPSEKELQEWLDENTYGVWLDSKRIDNNALKNYCPKDFSLYNVSKLTKTAINYGKHVYQVSLYSNEYYRTKIESRRNDSVIVREITLDNADTSKPKPLVVLDGVIKPDADLNTIIKTDEIESISVLKGESAIKKYGNKAKDGVIEIKSRKVVVREITLTDTNVYRDENVIFEKVEVEASFPGGFNEWKKFLQGNLDPTVPVKNGIKKSGDYTVVVQFVVRKDGSVSDVKALTKHGYGMEEEAMRMIKKGPHWVPAIQNGRNVNAYRKQPITFKITDQID